MVAARRLSHGDGAARVRARNRVSEAAVARLPLSIGAEGREGGLAGELVAQDAHRRILATLHAARRSRLSRWKNIEQRPCGPLHWQRTEATDPRQRDWVRLCNHAPAADAFVESGRYALFLDTFTWPAAAHAHVGDPRFIAPTLSFSIDFHQRSDSAWLLSDAHSPYAGDGRLAVHQRLWSPDGLLLASGTGTMICRPRPRR